MSKVSELINIIENNGEQAGVDFIKKNPDVLAEKDADGWFVIQLAAQFNLKDVFLESFSNIESLSGFKFSPIDFAIEQNNTEIINILLDEKNIKKLDLNWKYKNGDNLFKIAALYKKKNIAKELLKNNPQIALEKNNKNDDSISAIIQNKWNDLLEDIVLMPTFGESFNEIFINRAIQYKNYRALELLYPFSNKTPDEIFKIATEFENVMAMEFVLNSGDFLPGHEDINKLIDIACKKQETNEENIACGNIIKYLFDINLKFSSFVNQDGKSAWMLAIENENDEVFKALLKTNETVNMQDNYQLTPIFYAIEKRNVNYVKSLLKKGASLQIRDKYKNTPLMKAVEMGNKEIVDILLNYANNLEEKNLNEQTAMGIALKMRNVPIITSLIWAGAQIGTYVEVENKNILTIGVGGKPELFDYSQETIIDDFIALSKLGFNLNEKNEDGDTFLLHFIKNGQMQNFITLLKCKVEENIIDKDGNSALLLAAKKNNDEYLMRVVNRFREIDFNLKNKNNEDLFDICIKQNSLSKIEFLINSNIDWKKESLEKTLKFIIISGDIEKHWDFFEKKLGDLKDYADNLNNILPMYAIVGNNIKNFEFLLNKTSKQLILEKNKNNKSLIDLIESIPDTSARMEFETIYKSHMKNKKHP